MSFGPKARTEFPKGEIIPGEALPAPKLAFSTPGSRRSDDARRRGFQRNSSHFLSTKVTKITKSSPIRDPQSLRALRILRG